MEKEITTAKVIKKQMHPNDENTDPGEPIISKYDPHISHKIPFNKPEKFEKRQCALSAQIEKVNRAGWIDQDGTRIFSMPPSEISESSDYDTSEGDLNSKSSKDKKSV